MTNFARVLQFVLTAIPSHTSKIRSDNCVSRIVSLDNHGGVASNIIDAFRNSSFFHHVELCSSGYCERTYQRILMC